MYFYFYKMIHNFSTYTFIGNINSQFIHVYTFNTEAPRLNWVCVSKIVPTICARNSHFHFSPEMVEINELNTHSHTHTLLLVHYICTMSLIAWFAKCLLHLRFLFLFFLSKIISFSPPFMNKSETNWRNGKWKRNTRLHSLINKNCVKNTAFNDVMANGFANINTDH